MEVLNACSASVRSGYLCRLLLTGKLNYCNVVTELLTVNGQALQTLLDLINVRLATSEPYRLSHRVAPNVTKLRVQN